MARPELSIDDEARRRAMDRAGTAKVSGGLLCSDCAVELGGHPQSDQRRLKHTAGDAAAPYFLTSSRQDSVVLPQLRQTVLLHSVA